MCGPTPSRARDLASLPSPTEWPTRPIYLVAEDKVGLDDHDNGSALPLGKRIEFETDAFKGCFFLRLRAVEPSDNEVVENHNAYFEGKKRFYQMIFQGQFKEEGLTFNDLVLGDVYERPMKMGPMARGKAMKLFQKFMETLAPGLIFDIASDKPKVLAPLGGVQTICVNMPGTEPTDFDNLVEDVGKFDSPSKRRKHLAKPKHSINYKIDPDMVYTFEVYDNSMDFGTFHQSALGGKVDLVPTLNDQSMAFGLFHRNDLDKCLFRFAMWHERALLEKKAKSEGGNN